MPPDVINFSGKVLKKKSLEDKCCHILHFLSSHISVLPQLANFKKWYFVILIL